MSRNYIKVLLNQFSENKLVASLMKLFEAGGKHENTPSSAKTEVNDVFYFLYLYIFQS